MKAILFFTLFIFALSNRSVNRKIIEQLKKVAPFEVYELEENPFRDWTDEEIQHAFGIKKLTKPSFNLRRSNFKKIKSSSVNPVAEYDFRKHHPECMHPVRDQGKCGAGLLFASATSIEQTYCLKSDHEVTFELSAQHMLSCDSEVGGCSGTIDFEETGWFIGNIGLVEETCFPYTSQGGEIEPCVKECKDGKEWKTHKVASWNLPMQPEDMKQLIPRYGPFFNEFDLYDDFLNYKSGIYIQTSGTLIGKHAADIIGYSEEEGVEYWICQNSFGETWGESGFFRIRMGDCRLDRGAMNGTPIFD